MEMTQTNIQMSTKLQVEGDAVLQELGYTASEAVQMLWSFLCKHKRLPYELLGVQRDCALEETSWQELIEDSKGLATRMSGIESGQPLPPGFFTEGGYKNFLYDDMAVD